MFLVWENEKKMGYKEGYGMLATNKDHRVQVVIWVV